MKGFWSVRGCQIQTGNKIFYVLRLARIPIPPLARAEVFIKLKYNIQQLNYKNFTVFYI
jgi:hypothetical protein